MRTVIRLLAWFVVLLGALWWCYLRIEATKGTFSAVDFIPTHWDQSRPADRHYEHAYGIETSYPTWFKANLAQDEWDLEHWLSLLAFEEDRHQPLYLVVPRIGVIVPIHSIGDNSISHYLAHPADYFRYLEKGIVQHPGTISPLSWTGNYVLAGHTSYYANKPWRYKTIFQFLSLLQKDDLAIVFLQDPDGAWQRFFYRVDDTFVTHAEDTSILNSRGSGYTLTLYGCYPFGSLEKRIVAYAYRVFLD